MTLLIAALLLELVWLLAAARFIAGSSPLQAMSTVDSLKIGLLSRSTLVLPPDGMKLVGLLEEVT